MVDAAALVGQRMLRWGRRLAQPRTMSGLVAGGCILAASPLLLALLLAGAQLDRLTRHSERLVREGFAVVGLGSQLHDNVSDLERTVRQYAALQDPALAEMVDMRLARTEATLHGIEDQQLAPLADAVFTAQRELAGAAKAWAERPPPQNLERLAGQIQAIDLQAQAILTAGRASTDAEVERLRSAGVIARRIMLISCIAVVPLTALLVGGFSVVLMRPLRKLSAAIVALGHGRYGVAASIRFPEEMRRLGEQLDWLRVRLKQLEADKERFLTNISHELKTPLASLHEGAALLQEETLGRLGPRQREVTSILMESAGELQELIQNLLAYAEWRKVRQQAAMDWFDVDSFLDEVLPRHRLALMRRNIATELRACSGHLFGHRAQLRLALENLLSNAIKHAPAGTAIEIEAAARGGVCVLSVRDHGRGVPDRQKKLIFEPFVRGTEAEEAGIRGTGIGLSIVQETVLSHNGAVEVEDAEPGARFRLAWPHPPRGR
ncbi:MAG: HAMP domain-containing sensor histidine kinase [Nevskia sp.]|nr:HAMP domain-containing sensor histidine kinase [Nevskia sp.]